MTRFKWISGCVILIGGIHAAATIAGPGDCGVQGGGVFDAVVSGPGESGDASFGGSVIAKGCETFDNIHGMLFVNFADGSTFRITNFGSFSTRLDAVETADIMGLGTYRGEVFRFVMAMEEGDAFNDPYIVLQLADVLTNDVVLDARGWVTSGDFNVDL